MTTTFLTGPAGTGKTTKAIAHLRGLLLDHVPAHNILVLLPQQTLAKPYLDALNDPQLPASGQVDVVTLSSLSLLTTQLFWPLVADRAHFGRPHNAPIFLSIETAQYYLQQAIEPLIGQGYFGPNVVDVTISMPRLMSQILDNLNKAALMRLPHTEVAERLKASLQLQARGEVALEHTQACVNRFREFCLARNLLDFSLRIDTFYQHLWPVAGIHEFLVGRYRHLIVDNIEEDNTFSHTVLREWLPHCESALVINDEAAGYRIFLGANWRTARELQKQCQETVQLTESYVVSTDMQAFIERMARVLGFGEKTPPLHEGEGRGEDIPPLHEGEGRGEGENNLPPMSGGLRGVEGQGEDIPPLHEGEGRGEGENIDIHRAIQVQAARFYPEMIEQVVTQIEGLLNEGVPPNQIVVLSPFVSDALRFSFLHRMDLRHLPARAHRPSRPLRDEPAAKTMLTLARLAFPEWGVLPEPFDVTLALHQAIPDLDPIRARLLTEVVYRKYERQGGVMTSFAQIDGPIRERISYQAGIKFDQLRQWLLDIHAEPPETHILDHFFNRTFGELLSQPDFGFHDKLEAGEVVANLVDSARKFRHVAAQVPLNDHEPFIFPTIPEVNRAYLQMVEQGIFAAQYVRSWDMSADEEAVLIAPATTFLMGNRPVEYQFWLDAGSSGWWERISQPLTHPYILAADWEVARPWTDADEVANQSDRLYRLVTGLAYRCRKRIFIINAEIGEQGHEQRGRLLVALQQMLRQWQREHEVE